jgi:hypothetical protein
MGGRYRHTRWICERCGLQGTSEIEAREHYGHPAGWKLGGNQHPEIDKWDPDHPDREPGFFWTVDWRPVALAAAARYPEGHKRRKYWLERAAQLPVLGPERTAWARSTREES